MQFFDSTDQLCDLFLYDLFDPDVVYLVMTAQLLCNCGFTHSWRSNQTDSEWLGTQNRKKKSNHGRHVDEGSQSSRS